MKNCQAENIQQQRSYYNKKEEQKISERYAAEMKKEGERAPYKGVRRK
jgi:hypothetical protein